MAVRQSFTLTVDASGDLVYTTAPVGGRILQIDLEGGFDNAASVTIVGATSGIAILTDASKASGAIVYTPRRVVNLNTSGAALSFWDHIWLDHAGEALTITIASGGNAKSEVCNLVTDE